MGLETFGFIDDLNPTFPFGSDDVSEGDDHLRGVKFTLKNTFPSNDGPGSFPGMDFFFRDLDIRTATISDEIQSNPQVAIAATTIDGLSGVITGPNFGVNAVARTAPGQYEIQLTEQGWGSTDDLQIAVSATAVFVGLFAVALLPSQVNVGPGWFQILTQPNALNPNDGLVFSDCDRLHIAVFDAGRD